jgi:hypothetical protein
MPHEIDITKLNYLSFFFLSPCQTKKKKKRKKERKKERKRRRRRGGRLFWLFGQDLVITALNLL